MPGKIPPQDHEKRNAQAPIPGADGAAASIGVFDPSFLQQEDQTHLSHQQGQGRGGERGMNDANNSSSADPPFHEHTYLPRNLDFILDIPLEISVELGRTRMRIADILKLGQGAIVELSNPAGSALEVLVNNRPIAKGEVVVVNEKYGIRLTEILSVMERIEKLR